MASIPAFTMGARPLDFSPVENLLAGWRQDRNLLAQREFQERKFAEDQRQFNAQNLLAQQRFGEDQRQFGLNLDLRRDELKRQREQFGMSHGLDRRRLALAEEEAREKREAAFGAKAAGVAQMVLQEANPELAAAKWQRLLASDPRWKTMLGRSGVDPADLRSGAQYIIAQARGYREPEPYKLTELDPNKTLIGTNPRTGESKVIREPQESPSGPYKDMKQKADVEAGLRKEVTSYAQDYTTIRNASATIENIAKQPSAASDISLIFSFMKVLDPSSVVRETEFATAQNAAGVPERVTNIYNRLLSGQRLSPEQRADFIKQAQTIAGTQRQFYETRLQQYRGVSERLKVDPNNVILPEAPNGSRNGNGNPSGWSIERVP